MLLQAIRFNNVQMSLIAQKVELEDMLKKERMFTVSNALQIDSSKRKRTVTNVSKNAKKNNN
jgi:hypothetical protein